MSFFSGLGVHSAMGRMFFALLAVLLMFAGLSGRAEAKDTKKAAPAQTTTQPQGTPPAVPPASATAPLPPGAMPKMPDQYKLNLLIRTTIIAINQANKTGNYTVLRDLAAPDFQNVNSAEKLAEIFTGLRNSKFDLSPVLFFDPKLIRQPELLSNGMLRLTGFFDTRPQRVNFDLIFQPLETDWRLYAVNVGTKEAPPQAVQAVSPAPAQPTPAATPAAKTTTNK
jgi:hypothetical protein